MIHDEPTASGCEHERTWPVRWVGPADDETTADVCRDCGWYRVPTAHPGWDSYNDLQEGDADEPLPPHPMAMPSPAVLRADLLDMIRSYGDRWVFFDEAVDAMAARFEVEPGHMDGPVREAIFGAIDCGLVTRRTSGKTDAYRCTQKPAPEFCYRKVTEVVGKFLWTGRGIFKEGLADYIGLDELVPVDVAERPGRFRITVEFESEAK